MVGIKLNKIFNKSDLVVRNNINIKIGGENADFLVKLLTKQKAVNYNFVGKKPDICEIFWYKNVQTMFCFFNPNMFFIKF